MDLQDKKKKGWKRVNRWLFVGMIMSVFVGAFAGASDGVVSNITNLFYIGFLVSATAGSEVRGRWRRLLLWGVLILVLAFVLAAIRSSGIFMTIIRMWIVFAYYLFMQYLATGTIRKQACLLSVGSLLVLTIEKLVSNPILVIILLVVQMILLLRMIDPILYQIAMNHRNKVQYVIVTVVAVYAGVCLSGGTKMQTSMAAAKEYYVSASKGSDSNTGTSKSSALKTLKKAVQKSQDEDTIYLMDTQRINENLSISKKITIGRSSEATGHLIIVEEDAKLTLAGNTVLTGRKGTVTAKRGLILVKPYGTLVVKENAQIKNNCTDDVDGLGSAVVNKGYFYLRGSAIIQGNETKICGGGAVYNEAIFDMEGGTITKNQAGTRAPKGNECLSGGGVLNEGDFTMTGGTITKNNTTDTAGGVFNGGEGTFTMDAGTISYNTAVYRGGGIESCSGQFYMNGGKIIGNKAAESGGIHLTLNKEGSQAAYMEMKGGEVSENEATGKDGEYGSAGGIFANNGTIAFLFKGSVKNNVAANAAGGVYTGVDSQVIIKSGFVVSGNQCESYGGGVYVRDTGFLMTEDAKIQNNQAEYGGCIADKGEVSIYGIIMGGNRASKGSGIYEQGKLSIGGSVSMTDEENIYLTSEKSIFLESALNLPKSTVRITPSEYKLGRVCVRSGTGNRPITGEVAWFTLTKKDPYLLRCGEEMSQDAGVSATQIVISRTYTITYKGNDTRAVDNLPPVGTAYWQEPYTISSQIPVNGGRIFVIWDTKEGGDGTQYRPKQVLKNVTANLVLYAIWKNSPPNLQASDTYAVEDELSERVTQAFLLAAATAMDEEDGNLTNQIILLNWESLQNNMKKPYTQTEKVHLSRHLEVKYQVEDSGGKSSEASATLTIYLIEENVQQMVSLRFISQRYIDTIRTDACWGSEEKKRYLRTLLTADRSDIPWETLE